ncbi:MAG: NRDE family protein [Proteobacteria bacterium]|nr:NRDE family protein [Pseudomonadota bacterium]
MCLILIACGAHPDFPLVVAANRDEYYRRPTAQAAYWTDHQHILAGRDLECMGTWLGVTRSGRFAALTNFRDPRERKTDAPSRGHLVSDFLASDLDPRSYLDAIRLGAARYNGFNLLAGDADGVFCYSNRESTVQALSPGVHGLSNHLLDTPWPKVVRGKRRLQQALAHVPETEALQALSRPAHDVRLAVTPAAKRVLSEPRTTGAGFIDRLIHAEYADLEACLLTFDKAAARLEGARLIVG